MKAMQTNRIAKRILRITNILLLLAVPIVPKLAENLFHTLPYYGSFPLEIYRHYFIIPILYILAIVVLVRKRLYSSLYHPSIEDLSQSQNMDRLFWTVKLTLCSIGLLYCIQIFWSNLDWWYANFEICKDAGFFFLPLLAIELTERILLWHPIIRREMSSEHSIWIRLLFTAKSMLLAGVSSRKSMVEKMIHVIRILIWLTIVFDYVHYFNYVFEHDLLAIFLSRLGIWGSVITRPPRYYYLVTLRLVELFLFDPD